ncbi:MAG: hypothetical protein IKO19_07380 [Candidatus Riflebacteria bacterium]|nr:hypothetical protein [Candidatus Riflebacteria bacterium]
MRKSLSLAALAMLSLVALSTPINAAQQKDFSEKLNAIEDVKLRRTLSNSIAIGLITTDEELQNAISQSIDSREEDSYISLSTSTTKRKKPNNNNNGNKPNGNKPNNNGGGNSALASKITALSKNLKTLDQAASVKVQKKEGNKYENKLFADISGKIPAAYDNCVKLCELFDPHTNTPEMNKHGKAIKEFFYSIQNDPCIKEALKVTNTTIDDMINNWFGVGAGFEHVIAGEIKGTKVSGYHWWYRYYTDERKGRTEYISSVEAIGNPRMYTGSFNWDPDASGPLPNARKSKGGFTLQHSPMAILALGHIAIETCRASGNIPGTLAFRADINGETFTWQLYTMGGTIRSLYPMANRE